MDNGLSAEEAGEIVTQAAFYAGWPNAFTAAPVVGEVLINRSSKVKRNITEHQNLTHITTLERTVHEPTDVTSSDLWTAFNTVMNQN